MPHNRALVPKPLQGVYSKSKLENDEDKRWHCKSRLKGVNVAGLGVEKWTKKTKQRFKILILFSKEFFADLFDRFFFKSVINYHPKPCASERTRFPCRFASLFHFSAKQCVSDVHLRVRENPEFWECGPP